jgi:hypothetical protein
MKWIGLLDVHHITPIRVISKAYPLPPSSAELSKDFVWFVMSDASLLRIA